MLLAWRYLEIAVADKADRTVLEQLLPLNVLF